MVVELHPVTHVQEDKGPGSLQEDLVVPLKGSQELKSTFVQLTSLKNRLKEIIKPRTTNYTK